MIRFEVMKKLTSGIPNNLKDLVDLYDILSVNWATFRFTGDEITYTLTENDIIRPDLLSYGLYGTINYQNIIFILNNIGDLLNLEIGTELKIPKIEDLKKFMYDNRKTS